MPAVELKRQRTAEREPSDVRSLQVESADDLGEAIRVIRHPEGRRRIIRPTGAGSVPGHDGELIGELLDLTTPFTAITDESMQEDECWPVAGPLVGYAKRADLYLLHVLDYWPEG
jgi:hypothetical protein